eukprot:GEMP01068600.1.p1 GENE.GEMP01068600.1~~GEMP01068600.1.p1  ORF type:complete len:183 (+),score=18.42 GEMP01068600.1:80-628(+)
MRWFLLAVCVLCAKNDYTLHLATDRTDDKVHHAPDKHGEGFLPIRNDNQFLFVGEGSCLSPDKLLILAKPVFHDVTIDPSTEWAVECVNFCLKSSNCAGFTTIQKTRECAVIMANNRNYGGGIFAADGSDGVNCFRKASAPVSPTSRNGWETWGKISLAIIMIGVLFGIVHFLFAYFTRIGK